MAAVVSKTEDSNTVTTYFVSCLAGPKVNRRRVSKGDEMQLTEHQARGELASGALVTSKDRIDDPWGEKAAADAKAEAEADAEAADAKARTAAEAQAAADKAAEEARAAQHHDEPPPDPHPADPHA